MMDFMNDSGQTPGLINTENFIMSDSLEKRVDPNFLDNSEVWASGEYACDLEFNHISISGILKSFSLKKKKKTLNVLMSSAEAAQLLSGNFLNTYTCRFIEGEVFCENECNQHVDLGVQFGEDDMALVSMIIELSQDS